MVRVTMATLVTIGLFHLACERKPENSPPPASPAAEPAEKTGAAQPKPEPAPAASRGAGHSAEVIELGETMMNGISVRASRDKGDITPGGDAPIDVWVDGGIGAGVSAVRFWVGNQDAKGSVKARAEIENGKWHTHVEIPDPLPPGAQLWVEIEKADGARSLVGFDLQR